MHKEYAKLTADQFYEFIEFLPELLSMLRGVNAQLASTPAAKFDSVMPGDYGLYSQVYELPFIHHLSLVTVALNRHEEVHDMAASPDPQEMVLELIRKRAEVEDKPHHPEFDKGDVMTLAYSLGRTIQSMATYGRSISSLLQDVRENNNHDSLLKAIGCRLYNKIAEILHSGKAWAMDLWLPMGWKPGEDVWRLEFEFKRDFLKERGLGSLDSVLDSQNSLWRYATTEWLRLTIPNEADSTRSRWPTHHLWSSLASVDWTGPPGVLLEKYSNTRTPTEIRLITVVLGALTSYMAMHKIDNRAEAIDQILAKLYEHYSLVASRKELSFDEYLAQRIAVKGREFNTAVNSPGLADNLKQDFLDQGMDAYRRASRG